MPLCSCSVVPVAAEMRRKGASRSSCMAFLITAPETGADSILVTHAFFGPVAAIARPVASFVTAVATGAFCIGMLRSEAAESPRRDGRGGAREQPRDRCRDDACRDQGHGRHEPLLRDSEDCYVSPRRIGASLWRWLTAMNALGRVLSWLHPSFRRSASARRESAMSPQTEEPDFKAICKHIFRYGFVEVADDILLALLVGIALGGALHLAIPDGLMTHEGARWLAYPAMVLVGMPLYICASASTPIAAALVAKGLSPGAALVFLMTGPATNAGAIAVIAHQFGPRFAAVYVGGVIVVTVALGILIDALALAAGWSLVVNLEASTSTAIAGAQIAAAAALIALIIWRFRAGAFKGSLPAFARQPQAHQAPCIDAGSSQRRA